MNADSFKQPDLPDGDLDAELDLLLSEAKWPEADAETLMRLSALTTTALQASGEDLATTVKPLIAIKSHQQKRWMVIAVSIAGMSSCVPRRALDDTVRPTERNCC
jgi:hypothetical protein